MLASALYGTGEIKRAIEIQLELRNAFSGALETTRLGAPAIPGSIVRSYLSWFMMEVGLYEEGWAMPRRHWRSPAGRRTILRVLARLGWAATSLN